MKHFCRRTGIPTWIPILALALATLSGQNTFAQRPQAPAPPTGPWMNTSLSPDERADLVLQEMTLDEKVAVLHGVGMPTDEARYPRKRRF
jgi:beta-glucosidase